MLNLGVRAHDFGQDNLAVVADDISNKGFTSIQLALAKSIAGFDKSASVITPGFAHSVRQTLSKRDIRVAVLGCYINMTHPEKKVMDSLLSYFKAHLRCSRDFGISIVGTETGSVNADYSFNKDSHGEAAFNTFVANLSELVEEAENFSTVVCIEGVSTHVINTPERIKRVLDAIQSNNLQVIFDPVNLINEENYREQQKIIDTSFDLFGDRISVVHSKDFIIEHGAMTTVETGKGLLDYPHLVKILKHHKPNIDVLFENAVPASVHESVHFLNKIFEEV